MYVSVISCSNSPYTQLASFPGSCAWGLGTRLILSIHVGSLLCVNSSLQGGEGKKGKKGKKKGKEKEKKGKKKGKKGKGKGDEVSNVCIDLMLRPGGIVRHLNILLRGSTYMTKEEVTRSL